MLPIIQAMSPAIACFALPISVSLQWSGSDSLGGVYLALVAVGLAIGSTLLFFFMEFSIRYNLPPALGKAVCKSFREEIEDRIKNKGKKRV